jgi:hypothetical protein
MKYEEIELTNNEAIHNFELVMLMATARTSNTCARTINTTWCTPVFPKRWKVKA